MTNQVATKRPTNLEATVIEQLPTKKQKTYLVLESANARRALRKRSVQDLSSLRPSLNTCYRKQLPAKRRAQTIHGIATISDDEDDTTVYVNDHSSRNVAKVKEANLSTTFTFPFPPLPVGRPLAPAPSLPNFAPGATVTSKVFLFK